MRAWEPYIIEARAIQKGEIIMLSLTGYASYVKQSDVCVTAILHRVSALPVFHRGLWSQMHRKMRRPVLRLSKKEING